MTEVFKNEAPLTIAALFVIGGALERSGAVDHIGRVLQRRLSGGTRGAILGVLGGLGVFQRVDEQHGDRGHPAAGDARLRTLQGHRRLAPADAAFLCSILGGCCTLIGTSTNLLVNGALRDLGEPPMTMFELAPIGIPLAIAGIGYLVDFRSETHSRALIDHRQPGNRPAHHPAPPSADRRRLAHDRQAG